MQLIQNELARVEDIISEIDGEIYQDQKYKVDLEWWALGNMTKILNNASLPYPSYAEKREPPDADFKACNQDKNFFKWIEITEVLEPGRKRSKEYKNGSREMSEQPNIELWQSLKQRIKDKLNKDYGVGCWLLIYFNIIYGHISQYGTWHSGLLNNVNSWIQSGDLSFSNCQFEQILILNSSGKALVSIYPKTEVISPEKLKLI